MSDKEEQAKKESLKKFEAFQKFEKEQNKTAKRNRAVETSNFAEYIKQAKEKAILNSKQLQDNEDARNLAKEIHEIHKAQLGTLETISKTDKEIVDLEQDILKNGTLKEDQLKTFSKADKDHWKAMMQNAKEQVKQAKLLKKSLHTKLEIQQIEEKALPHLKNLAKAQKELNKQQDKYGQSVEQSLDFLDGIDDALNSIPIVGGILSKALGLDDIKEKLAKSLIESFNPIEKLQKKQSEAALNGYSNQIDRLNEVEGAASDVTKEVGGIAPELVSGAGGAVALETGLMGSAGAATGLMAALGPIGWIALAIGAIVMAFTAFKKLAYEVNKTQVDIANNLSISKDKAIELNQALNDQNVLWKDQVRITGYLSKTYGTISAALAGDIPRLRALQHNLQLSDESMEGISAAANLLGSSFKGTTDAASKFETIVINSTKELYNQAGVTISNAELITETKETLKDIGNISRINLALYGKSTTSLAKQVTIVRKLGLSFEGISKTMDTVLDFESSIEAEMKANVLLGTNMNLNAVREASLRGDVAQVAVEINKVMEDQNINLDKFNNMMPFQKKALAASLGMQADEVQMMLLKNEIGDENLIAGIKSGATTKQMLIDTGKLTDEQAASLIIAERKTAIEQDMAEIQDQLSQTLKANMPGVQAFLGAMADFGLEVEDAGGLGGWIIGHGRSAAEIKHDDAIKSASEETAALDAQITAAKTKEEKDKLQKEKAIVDVKGQAEVKAKADESAPGIGTYATNTALAAGAGAAIGSVVPVLGTAVGGILGGIYGFLDTVIDDLQHSEAAAAEMDPFTKTDKTNEAKDGKWVSSEDANPYAENNFSSANDALIRPGQKPIKFAKGDIVLAGTNLLDPANPMAENKDTSISGKLGELMNSIVSPIENLISGPSTPT